MIRTFIHRPVFTTMFILLLVVFGIKAYPNLGVDLYPEVEYPLVSVTVTYEGAAPEEMETLITKPIENRVSQVSGIKTLSSSIREGYSQTVLEFELGVDPKEKASEVREKVASVRKELNIFYQVSSLRLLIELGTSSLHSNHRYFDTLREKVV